VHGALREGHAQRSSNSAPAFSRVLRPATCPVHASGTPCAQASACESWLAGSGCGDASVSQRNRHRLVPASSGAKSSTRARGSMARWVCPRVVFGCRSRRAAPRSREARSCRQQGPRERGSDLRHTERFARVKGVDGRHRGWPAAKSSPAVAGRSRERRRAKASRRWKASRITIQRVNVHAFAKEVISAALPDQGRASAREPGGKRQGCQRHGSRAPQREDNARRGRAPPAEANRTAVEQAVSPIAQAHRA